MKSFLYLVVLAVVLGGLFVLFKPDRPQPQPQVAAQATAPSPATTQPAASAAASPAAAASAEREAAAFVAALAPAPGPAPRGFDLIIRRGQLVSGPAVIQVHQGDEVILRLTSDTADDLHLHGYDLHITTKPGETVSLRFTAARTGRFGYELHHAKAELGALEVYPQ